MQQWHAAGIGLGFHVFDAHLLPHRSGLIRFGRLVCCIQIDPTSFTQDPKEYVKHVVQVSLIYES